MGTTTEKKSPYYNFQVRDQQSLHIDAMTGKYAQKGGTMSRQNGRFFLVFLRENGRYGIA